MASRAIDLLNVVNGAIGWPRIAKFDTELSSTEAIRTHKLLALLNRTLRFIGDEMNWPFLTKDGMLQTVADINTGTCNINNGSQTVLFIGAPAMTESVVGRAFQAGSTNAVFRIEEFSSTTQLRLDRAWVEANSTNMTYVIAQDKYSLPIDFSRPVGDWQNFFDSVGIKAVDVVQFKERRRSRSKLAVGEPEMFAIYGVDASGNQVIYFDPYPDNVRLLPFSYQSIHPQMKDETDLILFPVTKEEIIIEAMVYMAQRDFNDDQRSDFVLSDFLRKQSQTLVRSMGPNTQRPKLTMSREEYAREIMRWRRGGLRVDANTLFDKDLI